MPITPKNFYMIRHGQTVANKGEYISGHLDTPLTDLGKEQAELARAAVEALTIKPDLIVHSHLSRARDTANIINHNLDIPMIEDNEYAEINFGDWEGRSFTPTCKIQKAWENFETPPNGESFDDFMARIKSAKNRALTSGAQTPLIVCHGGVFRAFAKIYSLNVAGVRNCHLHHFEPDQININFPWQVKSFDYDHNKEMLLIEKAEPFTAN